VKDPELGAHDYLMKPFAFSKVLARSESIRLCGPGRLILRTADLDVDSPRQRVMRSRRRIELTPKEFVLLTQLACHVGEVQSRMLLAEGINVDMDNDARVVNVHISRLGQS
jgi:two-component system copper resistance phosphate regulon response regulator CusR